MAAEQRHVDLACARLAVRRGLAADVGSDPILNTPSGLLQRDRMAVARAERAEQLQLGDLALCFGRIDTNGGEAWHLGRIGVDDDAGDPLVVDWRAPIAEPFYRATPAEPLGVVRRRHLRCRANTVLGLDDELLTDADVDSEMVVVGEAALLRALQRRRTGRMADIVATIQASQDEIIRAPLDGALVVQGGPGTGKTVIALHRIAYLLYSHRAVLESKGVLLVGPSATFLRYIERVLPSLGEQGARFATVAELVDGVEATGVDTDEAAAVKGDLRMSEVLAGALRSRQRPLRRGVEIPFGAYTLPFTSKASRRIVDTASAVGGSHNDRRRVVEHLVLEHLHRRYVAHATRARQAAGRSISILEFGEFAAAARTERAVARLLSRMWPLLTPAQLVGDLLSAPALLGEAAEGILTPTEQAAIVRDRAPTPLWTEADLALLDEVTGPLGAVPATTRIRRPAQDRDFMADRVLAAVADDPNISMSPTIAAEIRERIVNDEVQRTEGTVRRRRAGTSFGHVVVDESQDLSPMQWRMIARRCPAGSCTIVGDLGQASGLWNLGWERVLEIAAPRASRRIVELSVNYRTPAEVMELASRVLRAAAPNMSPPSAVRLAGTAPTLTRVRPDGLATTAAEAARRLLADETTGTVAVIAPTHLHRALRLALDAEDDTRSAGGDALDDAVALLTPTRAKGLEFDGVVVVEPAAIAAPGHRGLLSLYVALTRSTGGLAVVHADPLPAAMR